MDPSVLFVIIMVVVLYAITMIDQARKSKKASINNNKDNFYSETKTLEMPIYDSRENH